MYKCASAKRFVAPQCAHCPSAVVTSIANIAAQFTGGSIAVKVVVVEVCELISDLLWGQNAPS